MVFLFVSFFFSFSFLFILFVFCSSFFLNWPTTITREGRANPPLHPHLSPLFSKKGGRQPKARRKRQPPPQERRARTKPRGRRASPHFEKERPTPPQQGRPNPPRQEERANLPQEGSTNPNPPKGPTSRPKKKGPTSRPKKEVPTSHRKGVPTPTPKRANLPLQEDWRTSTKRRADSQQENPTTRRTGQTEPQEDGKVNHKKRKGQFPQKKKENEKGRERCSLETVTCEIQISP